MRLVMILLLSSVTICLAQTTQPATQEVKSITWLALDWVGPKDESIPPLVLYVNKDDLHVINTTIAGGPTLTHVMQAEIAAIVHWVDQHPAHQDLSPQNGFLQLTLGNATGVTSGSSMTTDDAHKFFQALARDLPLSPPSKTASASFAAAYGF